MTASDYKYDVAFSFVQQDEDLAFQLYTLLKDRLSCFIYSEQQKKLAGTNGEKVFNSVFSKEARIVVILFRREWGNTPWTRIEETAITNRGYTKGYDFVILIPTEHHSSPPEWFPKNRIWIGLQRWGIESAASAIEARVQEFGGVVIVESIADQVAKTENAIKEKQKREKILNSEEGLGLAFEEMKEVVAEIKKHETEIKSKTSDWHIKVRENKQHGCDILSYGYYLTFQFTQQWNNSPDGSYLYVSLYKGYFDENGNADVFSQNERIDLIRVRFDINEFNQKGWSLVDTRKNFMSTPKLVELWFGKLLKYASEEKIKRTY